MTDKQQKKITIFIWIHLVDGTDIEKHVSLKTCQKEISQFVREVTVARKTGRLLEIKESELVSYDMFQSKHYFDETIYVDPNKIAYFRINADVLPVATLEERISTNKRLADLIKKGDLTIEDQD